MSSNETKDIPNDEIEKPKYKRDIIVIGWKGRLQGTVSVIDYVKARKENQQKVSSKSKSFLTTIKEIDAINRSHQFPSSELADEIIDPNVQYFLAFCSFLYFVRACHMLYRVFLEIDKNKLIYDFNYDLAIFLVGVFFTIISFGTALNGLFFCWKMVLSFAFPYLLSLSFSTSLMGFRIIAPIIDKDYSQSIIKVLHSIKI